MGIKRYKNAIREVRANKQYLKFLGLSLEKNTILVEAGRGEDEAERVAALFDCLKEKHIEGDVYLALPSKSKKNYKKELHVHNITCAGILSRNGTEYRKIISTACMIITDDALPDYYIKKGPQKLMMLCDTLMSRRNGRSNLASAAGFGSLQRTLLLADELIFTGKPEESDKSRSALLKEYMINGFGGEGSVIFYAGDLGRIENCIITESIIRDKYGDNTDGNNIVVAFESELKPNVISFINSFDERIEFVQVAGGGAVTFGEYVWQYLYKNYGLAAAKAMRYYSRENDRLFSGINIREINFINTRFYERIEVILRSGCRKIIHQIPMSFYRQLIDVFFRHPDRVSEVFGKFDERIEYDKDYGIDTWKQTYCSGVYAKFSKLKIRIDNVKIRLTAELTIITDDPEAELADSFIIGSVTHDKTFEYQMEIKSLKKYRKHSDSDVTTIKCGVSVDFPCRDTAGWYINNLPMVMIKSCGHEIKAPMLIMGKNDPFFRKVYNIDETGCSFVIKEDYRQMRFVIREQVVTDKPAERIRLALAFACHIVTPWHKPVILCEKYCLNYEESASILFEKLIDEGYRNIRFVLNKDSSARNGIDAKYRKYILDQFSFGHYYTLFASKSIISSEAIGHSLEKGTASGLFKNFVADGSKNYVFLQHGVMYMVALSSEQRNFFRKGKGKGKQRVVVSSKLEADHFLDNTNYEPEDIYECGLIKFDRSIMHRDADKILVMLTWRPWEFVTGLSGMNDTAYYKMLLRIVRSVPACIKDKLVVMPHPLIINQIEPDTDDEVWKYFVPGIKYDDLLKETKLLITDYSSISYDAFYRGANVIFDWEEKDQCMKQYGANGRLMLTEELAFGKICYNSDELEAAAAKAYSEDQSEKYKSNYGQIVEYHDGHNSRRFIEMARKDGIL